VGYDFAGSVEAVGAGVTTVVVGDDVYGMINGWSGRTLAEFVVAAVDELAFKPATLGFIDAAAVPLAAMTALQALRDEAGLVAGDAVLIHGASGGVGTFAIQIAKHLGAQVTTTSSPANFELCRSLGATTALEHGDLGALAAAGPFKVFFDVFGNRSLGQCTPFLAPRAVYVTTVPSPKNAWQHVLSRFFKRRTRLVRVRSNRTDLEMLRTFIDAGVVRPVVEKVWPLEKAAEAQAHIETKRTRGKVVIAIE
jgi:NADPH:quinone reductase-like Zn-dependent oxidoreductase